MKLDTILTKRNYETWPSWDLVYEWEDQIAEELKLPLTNDRRYLHNKYVRVWPLVSHLLGTSKNAFIFDMNPERFHSYNRRNIVPCIIDFYPTEVQMHVFERDYKRNPVVCISSKEVYDWLKGNHCKLNLAHLALSISDKYAITPQTKFDKPYDLIVMGMPNKVLNNYLERYVKTHPDLYYVYRIQKGGQFMYYTSRGECLGDINTRDKYVNLMRKSRCALYSTPGIDGRRKTNGFNQVTPRFLEFISAGCHVISRYEKNSDTDFYEMDKLSMHAKTFEDFERALDYARSRDVDMAVYSEYLAKHYTSARANQLKNILEGI